MTKRVAVRLRHAKIHAQDCMDCDTREGRLDQIAERCPVYRTLVPEIVICTRLGP